MLRLNHIQIFIFLVSCFVSQLSFAQFFVENKGQLHDQNGYPNSKVNYFAVFGGFRVFLHDDGFSYEILEVEANENIDNAGVHVAFNRIDVVFADHSFSGQMETEGLVSIEKYYLGSDYYESRSLKKITYREVYPNIDVVFYANENGFKYDFVLHPGADLNAIQLLFDSPFKTELIDHAIRIDAPLGMIQEEIPYSFFKESNEAIEVRFSQAKKTGGQKFFQFLAPKNQNQFEETLIIDPMPNLSFGTYISGNLDEFPENVVIDDEGDIYVVGYTNSVNNIATSGTFQGSFQSIFDIFLVKYRPDGTKMWGTYIGGNSFDRAYGLAYRNGFIYICGNSFSQNMATPGVHQTINMNADDAFLAKFDLNGNRIWSTYYGGSAHDFASSVVVNSNDEIYITGHTLSYTNIATADVHMESFFGISAAFLAKFSSNGQLIWGTYYGSSFDEGYGIALDSEENIIFSGFTSSSNGIASPGAQQMLNGGGIDAFLVKFTPNGTRLWGTFFGGSADDYGYDVCVDAENNIYMVGNTSSLSGIATGTGFQMQAGSIDDGFVAKYNANGNLLWSTYVGGSEAEYISSVGLFFDQGVVIAGKTQSANAIATQGAHSGNLAGQYDAFLMKISPSGAKEWGSYFGGSLSDEFTGLAIDLSNGFLHTSGMTLSSDGISTPNAHQTEPGPGLFHGFLARFCVPFVPNFNTEIQAISCGNSTFNIDVEPANVFNEFLWHDATTTSSYNFTDLSEGQYFYFLSTLDTNNCSFTTDTVFFNVLPDVEINLSILYDQSAPICLGSTTTFFANDSFENYAWSTGAQSEDLELVFADLGEQWIALTVTDSNGCMAHDTVFFNVLESPNPVLQLSGAANFCVQETVIASTSESYSSYLWSNGTTAPQTEIFEDSWIWVHVTNSLGCSTTTDSIFVSSTDLLPTISLVNNPPICPNSSLFFEVDPAFSSYVWSTGETTNAIEVNSISGEQWIAVEVENLCGGVGTDTLLYSVLPEIDLSVNATVPELLCIGSQVSVSVSDSFTDVIWQDSNTGSNYEEIATQFGTWTITVQALDENLCPVFDTLILEVGACVLGNESHQKTWIVYPNPVQDLLTIQCDGLVIGKIEMFDYQGSIIATFEVSGDLISIALDNYSAGFYFLKIYNVLGQFVGAQRIVKGKP